MLLLVSNVGIVGEDVETEADEADVAGSEAAGRAARNTGGARIAGG